MAGQKPHVSNGVTSDPREQVMWDIYVTNLSKGIDNAMQAALEAKYEKTTAKNITLCGWYKERKAKLKRKDMLSDSEKLLHKTINYDHVDKDGNVKVDLLRVQTQVAMTLAESLGKEDGYSKRNEITGKDGEKLVEQTLTKEEKEALLGLLK